MGVPTVSTAPTAPTSQTAPTAPTDPIAPTAPTTPTTPIVPTLEHTNDCMRSRWGVRPCHGDNTFSTLKYSNWVSLSAQNSFRALKYSKRGTEF